MIDPDVGGFLDFDQVSRMRAAVEKEILEDDISARAALSQILVVGIYTSGSLLGFLDTETSTSHATTASPKDASVISDIDNFAIALDDGVEDDNLGVGARDRSSEVD